MHGAFGAHVCMTIVPMQIVRVFISVLPVIRAGASCLAHARQAVRRTPKGIVVMAPCLRVGTACSGLEIVPYALNKTGLRGDFQMAFICARDSLCRKLIRQCHRKATKPGHVFMDVVQGRSAALPDHDVYIAGFLCQPFSVMGAREGLQDSRGRGTHFVASSRPLPPRGLGRFCLRMSRA